MSANTPLSYKTMFLSMARGFLEVPKKVPDGRMMKRVTCLYVKYTQMLEKLAGLKFGESIKGTAKEMLQRLERAATTTAIKSAYDLMVEKSRPAFEESEKLTQTLESLKQVCTESRDTAFDLSRSAIDSVASGKNKEDSEAVSTQLSTAEKTLKSPEVQVERLKKDREVSDQRLADIAMGAYAELPPTDRKQVTAPVKELRARL